jgi:hypothetical protein
VAEDEQLRRVVSGDRPDRVALCHQILDELAVGNVRRMRVDEHLAPVAAGAAVVARTGILAAERPIQIVGSKKCDLHGF